MGLLSQDEVAEAETRHILSRSLGGGLSSAWKSNDHQMFPGDVLVLCSDGLHGRYRRRRLPLLLGRGRGLESAAQRLVDACQRAGRWR